MPRFALATLLLGLVAAGCTVPTESDQGATTPPAPTPTTTAPPPPAAQACWRFTVASVPPSPTQGEGAILTANFTNCGETAIRLQHACTRAMDLAIVELYNSTTGEPLPPGVGPKARDQVDGPIANVPIPCATAPPFTREVAPGASRTFSVAWSGLVANGTDARPLAPGRYLLAANAVDADTGVAYVTSTWLRIR